MKNIIITKNKIIKCVNLIKTILPVILTLLLLISVGGNIYQYFSVEKYKETSEKAINLLTEENSKMKKENEILKMDNKNLVPERTASSVSTQNPKTTTVSTAKIGEEIKLDNTTITVTSIKTASTFRGLAAPSGEIYYIITFDIITSLKPGEIINYPYFYSYNFISAKTSGGYDAPSDGYNNDDKITQNKKVTRTHVGRIIKEDKITEIKIHEPSSQKYITINCSN